MTPAKWPHHRRKPGDLFQPSLIPNYARNEDGSVDPEAADAHTLLSVNDLRVEQAHRKKWGSGRDERYRRAVEREDFDPEHDAHLSRLLELSGATADRALWGPVFSEIAAYDSAAMAIYCLYVTLGFPEDAAYHVVYPGRGNHKLPDPWKARARPFIAALLARLMPSKYRLLMHMEQLIADQEVDASVRSGMMQFMARYMLGEAAPAVPASGGARDGVSSVVQSFVQEAILKRGGSLLFTIPPEPAVIEAQ